jgi:acetylornithine deacetylase/succinyl-diaminopimelate desuccinylase-like protein
MSALVDDLLTLAAIPAPTFDEEPRLQWLEERLDGAPGRRARDAAGNLIWSWGEDEPRVIVAAHVDTVFPAATELAFRTEGDDVVGPGVGDNAAAVAVAVAVVERVLAEREPAPGAVAFTVGEEGLGNLRGAIEVCRGAAPDAFLALEGHMLDEVVADAVGSVRARVTVRGPGGHSWRDRGRASAIDGLLEVAARLRILGTTDAPVNVGVVRGGRSVNSIADEAELLVERRALDQPPLDAFAAVLADLALAPPLTVQAEIVGRRPAGRLPRDAPLLEHVLAVRRGLGLPEVLGEGSTDANAALAAGIPALCLGCGRGSGMHTPQERIDTASLALGAAQLRALLEVLLPNQRSDA